MSDTIIYEHPTITFNNKNQLPYRYNLVKFNNQVLHIYTESVLPGGNPNIVVIKNLNTQEQIKFMVELNKKSFLSDRLSTFMYSDFVLWIGVGVMGYSDIAYIVNMQTKEIKRTILTGSVEIVVPKSIETIVPIGQKYFQFESNGKVFTWNNLVQLDNSAEPVYVLSDEDALLFPINWSSSSIDTLANSSFIKTKTDSEFIELLDENFKFIFQLNVKDLFPDYINLPLNEDYDDPDFIISVNDNLLLYVDILNYVQHPGGITPGVANCYCWDFTTNSQVKFPSIKLSHWINNVVPFRSYNNGSCKIKFLSREGQNASQWSKIYESV